MRNISDMDSKLYHTPSIHKYQNPPELQIGCASWQPLPSPCMWRALLALLFRGRPRRKGITWPQLTSIASFRSQWASPDLNRQLPTATGTAGSQLPARMSEEYARKNVCQIDSQNICQVQCLNICQLACQSICQIECQNMCQIECQNICQIICQTECEKPDGMPEYMSDILSECMSDRMPEYARIDVWIDIRIYVYIYIYISDRMQK